MAERPQEVVFHLLEITIISAQGLKPPSAGSVAANIRRLKAYAVAWVDPSTKLHTLVDRIGGENPTWNEKFLFRVPTAFLAADSASAVHIEIYAVGLLVDSLIGTVDFLVGNQRLLSRPHGEPCFTAVGIRRPSGRFRGILNIGSAILPQHHVSSLAAQALAKSGSEAIGYRFLMGENHPGHKIWRQRLLPQQDLSRVLKVRNAETGSRRGEQPKAPKEDTYRSRRKNSLDPSDQNFAPPESSSGQRS